MNFQKTFRFKLLWLSDKYNRAEKGEEAIRFLKVKCNMNEDEKLKNEE